MGKVFVCWATCPGVGCTGMRHDHDSGRVLQKYLCARLNIEGLHSEGLKHWIAS